VCGIKEGKGGTMRASVKLWLKALRSGTYKQARSKLHMLDANGQTVGLCCLGVACEVFIQSGGELKMEKVRNVVRYGGRAHYLPAAVQEWLGLCTEHGSFEKGALANKNDYGATFTQIADLIESNPSGLFVETAEEARAR